MNFCVNCEKPVTSDVYSFGMICLPNQNKILYFCCLGCLFSRLLHEVTFEDNEKIPGFDTAWFPVIRNLRSEIEKTRLVNESNERGNENDE